MDSPESTFATLAYAVGTVVLLIALALVWLVWDGRQYPARQAILLALFADGRSRDDRQILREEKRIPRHALYFMLRRMEEEGLLIGREGPRRLYCLPPKDTVPLTPTVH